LSTIRGRDHFSFYRNFGLHSFQLTSPYASVFSEDSHQSVGKAAGETAHMERWNNTLRQRVGRMVRKTLSFSKCATWHDGMIHWFVVTYNSSLSVNV